MEKNTTPQLNWTAVGVIVTLVISLLAGYRTVTDNAVEIRAIQKDMNELQDDVEYIRQRLDNYFDAN